MDAAQYVTLAASASAVIAAGASYLRVRPEARKMDAESGTQIGNAGLTMAREEREEVKQLRREFDAMRHREVQREHLLVRHASWDHRFIDRVRLALPEFEIEDPPPLFLPEPTN